MFFARHGDSRDEGDMPAKLYIYSLYAPTSMVRGSWRMPTTAPRTNLDNLLTPACKEDAGESV